jgi:hypothetical protein
MILAAICEAERTQYCIARLSTWSTSTELISPDTHLYLIVSRRSFRLAFKPQIWSLTVGTTVLDEALGFVTRELARDFR